MASEALRRSERLHYVTKQIGWIMAKRPGSDKPLVIWVDDDRDFQNIVREWLEPLYDLVTYDNGDDFLNALAGLEPDIVILDVRLPGPDGFKLCRRLRSEMRLASVPILFLTSCGEDIDYIKHLDVGGTEYLNKPIEKETLLKTLAELLTSQRKPETLRWEV